MTEPKVLALIVDIVIVAVVVVACLAFWDTPGGKQ